MKPANEVAVELLKKVDGSLDEAEQLAVLEAFVREARAEALEELGMACENPCGKCCGCLYAEEYSAEQLAKAAEARGGK